jgi:hypothetical protein
LKYLKAQNVKEGPSLEAQEEISISEEIPAWTPEIQDQAVSVSEESDLTPEAMLEPETRADRQYGLIIRARNVPG